MINTDPRTLLLEFQQTPPNPVQKNVQEKLWNDFDVASEHIFIDGKEANIDLNVQIEMDIGPFMGIRDTLIWLEYTIKANTFLYKR